MKVEIDIKVVCTCGEEYHIVSVENLLDRLIPLTEITVSPCPNPECMRRQEEDHGQV